MEGAVKGAQQEVVYIVGALFGRDDVASRWLASFFHATAQKVKVKMHQIW